MFLSVRAFTKSLSRFKDRTQSTRESVVRKSEPGGYSFTRRLIDSSTGAVADRPIASIRFVTPVGLVELTGIETVEGEGEPLPCPAGWPIVSGQPRA
jgi:hypothetical protein